MARENLIFAVLVSLDEVRNVEYTPAVNSMLSDSKSVEYKISWSEPLAPNGLIYFYTIHIDPVGHNAPKDERCVGADINSVNITLLPRSKYRLRILAHTISRLNREYDEEYLSHFDNSLPNGQNSYYQILFTTIDLSSK